MKGKLLIVTAPSGAGKTTIVRHLLKTFDNLGFSVSATNRPPRDYEEDGRHYYFLSTEAFFTKVENQAFLEWEEVYEGRYYGTLKSEVDRLLNEGKHIVFDIEVKGATNIKKAYPDNSLAIFVKPPSPEVLFQRLRDRNTETEDSLNRRIARAAMELKCENQFDVVLLNDKLEESLASAERIVGDFLEHNLVKHGDADNEGH